MCASVYTNPGELSHMDWILLCTKARQIESAAHWLRCLIGPDTRVGVMQNGVDHVGRASAYLAADRVVPCIIFLPVRVEEPGVVEQARAGTVQVPKSQAGYALADLFGSQSAVKVEPTADFVSAVWSKLVLNAVGGAICALALKPLSAVAATQVRELAIGLMEEVLIEIKKNIGISTICLLIRWSQVRFLHGPPEI
jgi:2-dehydropantoate 2-reductase